MVSELSKLLDRNFAIGFVLPVAIWMIVSGLLLRALHRFLLPEIFTGSDPLILTVVFGFVAWAGGVVLSAFNRGLFRLLEGYGRWANPFYYLRTFEARRYTALEDEVARWYAAKNTFPKGSQEREQLIKVYNRVLWRRVQQFPDAAHHVLPTPFGNTIRAFQVYPRVMYGLEGVQGWYRLLTVVPKDYLGEINDAKSLVNMWLNLWFLATVTMVEAIICYAIRADSLFVLAALGAAGFALLATQRAASAAITWGEYVKATFDVFLPDLAKKMGYKVPVDRNEASEFWAGFSRAIIYHKPKQLPERAPTAQGAAPEAEDTT